MYQIISEDCDGEGCALGLQLHFIGSGLRRCFDNSHRTPLCGSKKGGQGKKNEYASEIHGQEWIVDTKRERVKCSGLDAPVSGGIEQMHLRRVHKEFAGGTYPGSGVRCDARHIMRRTSR